VDDQGKVCKAELSDDFRRDARRAFQIDFAARQALALSGAGGVEANAAKIGA
jgi:hypothetical protein